MRFAIVGCGSIGRRHAAIIATLGTLVAVCDAESEKADALAADHNITADYDIEALIARHGAIDVFVICTPNHLHAPHSILALRAGCDVICEKPMALNVHDAELMLEAARQTGKHLFIVKQNRFNDAVIIVRRLIDEQKLGKIYSLALNCIWNRNNDYYRDSWRGKSLSDGGILYTQFSHFIDLLYWYAGEVHEVAAFTANSAHKGVIEFEDNGVACMKFKSGTLGSIHFTVNAFDQNMEGSLTIVAENGTIKVGGKYLDRLEYLVVARENQRVTPEPFHSSDHELHRTPNSKHNKFYEHVIDVLTTGSENLFDGKHALKTIEIIEQIYCAATRSQS